MFFHAGGIVAGLLGVRKSNPEVVASYDFDLEIVPLVAPVDDSVVQRTESGVKVTLEESVLDKIRYMIGHAVILITMYDYERIDVAVRLVDSHQLPAIQISENNHVLECKVNLRHLADRLNDALRDSNVRAAVGYRAGNAKFAVCDVIDVSFS